MLRDVAVRQPRAFTIGGEMTRWQYLTAPLIIHNTQQILDNFGADGWELVQVVPGPTGGLVAYFKRPVEG
ncbi:MAG: DUF4177 domain-containing protein [Pseudoclavibacter caeni]|jgi:hypothetical protein